MTDAIGAHFFHRWKGYWGTSAAFSQRYAGGEPMPGPPAPPLTPTPLTIAALPPAPVSPAPMVQPAYAQASLPIATPVAAEDHLPAASTVLERWKNSGKPL